MQESIKKLIGECANLNIRLIKKLPSDMQFMVWSSPTSVRNPEISIIWHPIYSRRRFWARLFAYFPILAVSIARGIYKLLSYKGLFYAHIKGDSSVLLVVPEAITEQSDSFKTNYLIEEDGYSVDKLIFSHSIKRLKGGNHFSVLDFNAKINLFLKLIGIMLSDFKEQLFQKKITKEYMDALMIFTAWIASQSWYFIWDFYHLIAEITAHNRYKSLLALHEMHFYSRVLWQIADERKLVGVTAQHGLIIQEKLWYFPDKSESQADCPLPDIFFVYSDEIKENLQPLYPQTRFLRCCSSRFKHWKSAIDFSRGHNIQNNKRIILIANSAAILHDNVVLKALRRLAGQRLDDSFTLRLRLHPKERLRLADQLWVRGAKILRRVEISSNSLQEDFKKADLVIGANSTVVYEALLMSVPVMGVFDECYIASSILPSYFTCHISSLTKDALSRHMERTPDENMTKRFKANIGIFSPDLTTKLIFEALGAAGQQQ